MPLPLYSEEEDKIKPPNYNDHANFKLVKIQVTHLRSGYVGKAVNGGGLKELLQDLRHPVHKSSNWH